MDRDPIEAPFRPAALMSALVGAGVEFVVVGGIAVTIHGYERFTADLDLIPDPDSENLQRLAAALEAVREGGEAITAEELYAPNTVVATRHGRAHVIREVSGLPAFDGLSRRSIEVEFSGEVTVRICAKEDLIAMKRAAGRPRDALDVMYLTEGE